MLASASQHNNMNQPASDAEASRMRLLNDYQRDFPVVSQPFAQLAQALDVDEAAVLKMLSDGLQQGVLSRVGAVFAPRRIGASALAALSAPTHRIEEVAACINAHAEVNHNYQREHAFNLWFVITAASGRRLGEVVEAIERDSGCKVIVMPLEQAFHIDLGFDLCQSSSVTRDHVAAENLAPMSEQACLLPDLERAVMAELERGLPVVSRPFHEIGRRMGVTEALVMETIESWLFDGRIKRFGLVVRHHELGFCANAMCVWDVPDDRVAELGERLAREPAVTLCYRRSRARPHWPYNLFCMIHGRTRESVLQAHAELQQACRMNGYANDVLFSTRRFKQRGSRYFAGPQT